MNISHELNQKGIVFHIEGELDHHMAHATISYLTQQISLNRPSYVELDFTFVTFMDSSGLAVVMHAKRIADYNGGKVFLRNVPDHAKRIFQAACMEKIVSFL